METLRNDFAIDLRVLGIATSKTMLLQERGVNLDTWQEDLKTQGKPLDMEVRMCVRHKREKCLCAAYCVCVLVKGLLVMSMRVPSADARTSRC